MEEKATEVFEEAFGEGLTLDKAITERETGCPLVAIVQFKALLRNPKLALKDRLLIQNHLGLGYFHAGPKHYAEAVRTFEDVDDTSGGVDSEYAGYKAVALRNLARPQFIGYGDIVNSSECDRNIYDARNLAKKLKRNDLVWFTHGTVALRIFEGYIDSNTRKLFWDEVGEWFTLAQKESKRDKQVWLLGIFADFVRLYLAALSVPALKIAKWYAHKNNLARREEQIQKALNQVTKK